MVVAGVIAHDSRHAISPTKRPGSSPSTASRLSARVEISTLSDRFGHALNVPSQRVTGAQSARSSALRLPPQTSATSFGFESTEGARSPFSHRSSMRHPASRGDVEPVRQVTLSVEPSGPPKRAAALALQKELREALGQPHVGAHEALLCWDGAMRQLAAQVAVQCAERGELIEQGRRFFIGRIGELERAKEQRQQATMPLVEEP
eukprot:1005015-Pleurochrysis_carterae.AAC.3